MNADIFSPTIVEFQDDKQFYRYAESFVIDEMLELIGEEGTFRLALSGGSTPLPLYHVLGQNSALSWEEVELYQTDERFVKTTNTESNQYNIIKAFGEETIQRIESKFFIPTDSTVEFALLNYNEVIDSLDVPTFDLAILGIGRDGHFASLFPNNDYLAHQEEFIIQTHAGSQYPTRDRVSLTIETILKSRKLLVLLNGDDKSEIVSELISGSKSAKEFPAKFLLAHPKLSIFVNTPEAKQEVEI